MGKESIVGKIVIDGTLILDSPLLIGSGGEDGNSDAGGKDIRVLRGKMKDGNKGVMEFPFIPGTSLAGVLRQNADVTGYEKEFAQLFGDMETWQSAASIEDVKLENSSLTYRDGVRIDSILGTATDGSKYDYETVDRGAKGKFRIELTLRGCHTDQGNASKESKISQRVLALAALIRDNLKQGIRLGAMTSKGFGKLHSEDVKS